MYSFPCPHITLSFYLPFDVFLLLTHKLRASKPNPTLHILYAQNHLKLAKIALFYFLSYFLSSMHHIHTSSHFSCFFLKEQDAMRGRQRCTHSQKVHGPKNLELWCASHSKVEPWRAEFGFFNIH